MDKIMTFERPGEITIFFRENLYWIGDEPLGSIGAAILKGWLTDVDGNIERGRIVCHYNPTRTSEEETRALFDDDEHILYVNGSYRDDTPIGKLMHDFSCTQPDDMEYSLLADRVRYFKETERGREMMSSVFEELLDEGREEGALQNLIKNVMNLMEKMDWSLEKTMEILGVSDAERKFLKENVR